MDLAKQFFLSLSGLRHCRENNTSQARDPSAILNPFTPPTPPPPPHQPPSHLPVEPAVPSPSPLRLGSNQVGAERDPRTMAASCDHGSNRSFPFHKYEKHGPYHEDILTRQPLVSTHPKLRFRVEASLRRWQGAHQRGLGRQALSFCCRGYSLDCFGRRSISSQCILVAWWAGQA